MCISTAQARTKSAPWGSQALGLRHFHCKFSHERAVQILLHFFVRGPCIILYKSFVKDLVEILVRSSLRSPCMKSFQMPCLRGACMHALVGSSWEVLVSRSCEIRSSSSRPFFDDLVTFH